MTITLKVENSNPFNAGWLACHMGISLDKANEMLPEMDEKQRAWFHDGFQMREETATMQDFRSELGHGGCHIAFLYEATHRNIHLKGRHILSLEARP